MVVEMIAILGQIATPMRLVARFLMVRMGKATRLGREGRGCILSYLGQEDIIFCFVNAYTISVKAQCSNQLKLSITVIEGHVVWLGCI